MKAFHIKTIWLPLAFLALGSLLFRVFPWDMEWADEMHSPAGGWDTDVTGFWDFLYDFGVVPAVITVLAAFILLMLGVGHPLRRFRKISLYVISCLALGPGLITNGLLKEFWGRPRPKQIDEFGGAFPYEPLLTIDPISTGKSFPCGHATMGFFFFCLAFAFLHQSKNWMRWGALLALIFGGLIGYARLVQGGHFPSDTLWAAGVCWFTSLGLYYAYGLHRNPLLKSEVAKRRPWWMVPTLLGGCVAILLTVSLATPYDKKASVGVSAFNTQGDLLYKKLIISGVDEKDTTVSIDAGTQIFFSSKGDGHRFPKSRHKVRYHVEEDTLFITLYRKGFFTELNLRNTVVLPTGVELTLKE